jgi:hypothetical protein
MKKLFSILFITLVSWSEIFALAMQDKIFAIVNDKPITMSHVLQVKKMLILFGKVDTITPDIDRQLNQNALDSIINQTLIQEQKKAFKIKVLEGEIQMTIKDIEANNQLPEGFFKNMFRERGIDYKHLEDKIESDILFKRITQQLFVSNILIDKDEVDNVIIASNLKNANFTLKIFTSNALDNSSYKNMLRFRKKLNNCDKLPKKQDYEKFASLKEVKEGIHNLQDSVRSATQGVGQNQTSAVLKGDDGFQIVMVCAREIENLSQEESSSIVNAIGNDKLNKQTQRFYTNLRKKAYIKIFDL